MDKLIVGLTGGIASGKTTVANLFIKHGIDVVDADIVAREVVAKGSDALAQITAHFGQDIIDEHGELHRQKLREIIFSQPQQKLWLNNLLHPLIRHTIVQQLQQTTSVYCMLVAPLLMENNMQNMVSRTLVVDTDVETQIQRTVERDNSDASQAVAIIDAQIARQQRLSLADDVIENNGMINSLTNDVKKLHDEYLAYVTHGT